MEKFSYEFKLHLLHTHTQSECHSVCVRFFSVTHNDKIQANPNRVRWSHSNKLMLDPKLFFVATSIFSPFYFSFHLKLLFVLYSNDDSIGCVKHIRHIFYCSISFFFCCLSKLHDNVWHQHRKCIFHKMNVQP